MIISKIDKQKSARKKYPRYNIFVDGEYRFSASEYTLLKYKLFTGNEINDEIINEIMLYDEFVFAKSIALDFLSYRIRTEKEIRNKLITKKISGKTIDDTISHLKKLNLINDYDFAQTLIAEKQKLKPAGKKSLLQKLYQKGVNKKIIDEVIGIYFKNHDEKQLAMESVEKYLNKIKNLDDFSKKKKVYSFLMRKGYEYDTIKEVINQIFQ